MRIDVVTLFPQMFAALCEHGITRRAIERRVLELGLWNPRDFTRDRHRRVDDHPYGGGPGMVMSYQPLDDAIAAARQTDSDVVYLSPQGRRFTQQVAMELLARQRPLVLVAGRYEGVDERLIEARADEQLSIGDFVLSGGELAAMVVIDTLTRLLPGALGHEDSSRQDSFADGLLEFPQYTRPEQIDGRRVPDVLLSGDHAAIHRWRLKQSLGRTWQRRPDLLEQMTLDDEQRTLLAEFIEELKTSK